MRILFVVNVLGEQIIQCHLLVDILGVLVRGSAVRCYYHKLDGVGFCMLPVGMKSLEKISHFRDFFSKRLIFSDDKNNLRQMRRGYDIAILGDVDAVSPKLL